MDCQNRRSVAEPRRCKVKADLEQILASWHSTTVEMEQTHESLCAEVVRLNDELRATRRDEASGGRTAGLGKVASQVAGELHNQLAPILLNLSLLRRRMAGDVLALNLLGKIDTGLSVIDATVNDLAQYAGDLQPRWCTFSLEKLLDEIIASLGPRIASQSVTVVIDVPKAQAIRADRHMTRQAIVNLVLNALDAMPDGGTVTITSAVTEHGLEIEVADTGPGLDDAVRRRVFEPFFTTKGSAVGLGLATVHQIVESQGGYITAINCPEGGAAFTFCLPQQVSQQAVKAVA